MRCKIELENISFTFNPGNTRSNQDNVVLPLESELGVYYTQFSKRNQLGRLLVQFPVTTAIVLICDASC